jgi:hypothetical protein
VTTTHFPSSQRASDPQESQDRRTRNKRLTCSVRWPPYFPSPPKLLALLLPKPRHSSAIFSSSSFIRRSRARMIFWDGIKLSLCSVVAHPSSRRWKTRRAGAWQAFARDRSLGREREAPRAPRSSCCLSRLHDLGGNLVRAVRHDSVQNQNLSRSRDFRDDVLPSWEVVESFALPVHSTNTPRGAYPSMKGNTRLE